MDASEAIQRVREALERNEPWSSAAPQWPILFADVTALLAMGAADALMASVRECREAKAEADRLYEIAEKGTTSATHNAYMDAYQRQARAEAALLRLIFAAAQQPPAASPATMGSAREGE